jgi:undecaprenyl-diphosphatase
MEQTESLTRALNSCFNGPYVAGAITAAFVGLFAIYVVMGAVKRGKLEYFAYYCFTAGIAGMIFFSQS